MKKTMIALVALSGLAMADTTTSYDLLTTSDNWTLGSARYSGTSLSINTDDAQISITGSNWAQGWAKYTFETPITLADKGDKVDFSYVLSTGTHNAALTVALIDTEANKAVTVGMGNYSAGAGVIKVADSDVLTLSGDGNVYSFENVETKNMTVHGTYGTISAPGIKGISGDITVGDNGAVATFGDITVNLGSSFKLDQVVILIDGKNESAAPTASFLNVTHTDVAPVPEPATATLSLLALAGLAARRRRH